MALYLIVANQTIGGDGSPPRWTSSSAPAPAPSGSWCRSPTPRERSSGTTHRSTGRSRTPTASPACWPRAGWSTSSPDAAVRARPSGEVVDALPVGRVQELLREEHFDGVVVSTLPRRLSRWLLMDLPHRIARVSDVPVTRIEGNAGPSVDGSFALSRRAGLSGQVPPGAGDAVEPATFHEDVPALHDDLRQTVDPEPLVAGVVDRAVLVGGRQRPLVRRVEHHEVGVGPRGDRAFLG